MENGLSPECESALKKQIYKTSVGVLSTYPSTMERRNLNDRSTTSSQTLDMALSSKSVPSGSDRRASRDSCKRSLQRSESSSDLHALRRNANAKLRAARDPTRARPRVAFSVAGRRALL